VRKGKLQVSEAKTMKKTTKRNMTKKRITSAPPESRTKPSTKAKRRTMAQAFDEWDRLYIEEPEKFGRLYHSLAKSVKEGLLKGKATSRGYLTAAWLAFLMSGKPITKWGSRQTKR
jgi:hypothetical protein